MNNIIEIIALITGIFVIIIETAIIFILNRHVKALNTHLYKNEALVMTFESNMKKHLEHLNEHSHEIERKLEMICGPRSIDNNQNGITRFKHIREKV